jgi:hypothetical protein
MNMRLSATASSVAFCFFWSLGRALSATPEEEAAQRAKERAAAQLNGWRSIIETAPFLKEFEGYQTWNNRIKTSRTWADSVDYSAQPVAIQVEIMQRAAVYPLMLDKLKEVFAENVKLKARNDELSATLKSVMAPAKDVAPKFNPEGWKDKANWRKLTKGMSKNDVTHLLGEPTRINSGGILDFFYYGERGGRVQFTEAGGVDGWSEPY